MKTLKVILVTGEFPPPADPTNPLSNNTQYDWDVTLSSIECYTFTIYDYYGDGFGASQWGEVQMVI